MKNLFGQQGFGSGGRAGEAKASLRKGTMELGEGNAGEAVGPEEMPGLQGALKTIEDSVPGRGDRGLEC